MKKTVFPLCLALGLLLAGCDTTASETTSAPPPAEEVTTDAAEDAEDASQNAADAAEADLAETTPEMGAAGPVAAEDCTDFLDDYEAYAEAYASLAAKLARNPTDASLLTEYTQMAAKAQEMQEDKPDACQTDAVFLQRYTSITATVSKAAAAQAAGSARLIEQMSKQMPQ